jgi:hypothetical protein
MSDMIAWIRAEAERPDGDEEGGQQLRSGAAVPPFAKKAKGGAPAASAAEVTSQGLVAHQFPARVLDRVPPHRTETSGAGGAQSPPFAKDAGNGAPGEFGDPSMLTAYEMEDISREEDRRRRIYRGRTVAMLRRYMRYSIETGRLPSMLGCEFFRAKVTTYTVVTFEDRVIFVHDMEKCLGRLDEFSRQLIARHILQEHDRWATAKLLHCNEKTVRRYTPVVLDVLSEILLEVGLLERVEPVRENSCQGGKSDQSDSSSCDDGKYKV